VTDCTVWWSTPLPEAAEYLALLDPLERERHTAYRQQADRRRFLTGRVLAKTVVADLLGVAATAVRLDASCPDCDKQHGRPRVPGAELALSISHSGERIGLAVTPGPDVGLDVEAGRHHTEDSLISYVLNDTELAALDRLEPSARGDAFLTYWTRKEAAMKATGRGLRIPLRSLTMSEPGIHARLLASADGTPAPESTRMADLDPGPGYRAAVAVLTADEIELTQRWWSPAPVPDGQ
jgi:4'-phosphopantetheinyl transferase